MSGDFEHLVRVERKLLIGERILSAVDQLAQDLSRVGTLQRVNTDKLYHQFVIFLELKMVQNCILFTQQCIFHLRRCMKPA